MNKIEEMHEKTCMEDHSDITASKHAKISKNISLSFSDFVDVTRLLNYKEHPEYFNIVGSGSQKRVSLKSKGELYSIFINTL